MNVEGTNLMPAGAVCVRTLTAADAPEYTALRLAMLLDSPPAFSASPGSDQFSTVEFVREWLAQDNRAIVGAFLDRRLVGAAGLFRAHRPKSAHLATIWGVWVEPTARGHGLGEAVMREAIRIARSWPGVRAICLSTGEKQTAAQRLYQRLGFEAWGLEPQALMHEGRFFKEVHMQLNLADSAPTVS